jgi:hypothetical protein
MKLVETVKLLTCNRVGLVSNLGREKDYKHFTHEALSLGPKRPEGEAEYLPPSSAEVKNGGTIPKFPRMSS